MLAKRKSLFESAAETIYQLDNDPQIRWLCDAYNATLARERYYHNTLAEKNAEIDSQKAEINSQKAEFKRLKALLAEQNRT